MPPRFPIQCALGGVLALLVLGCQASEGDEDAQWLAQSAPVDIDAGLVAPASDASVRADASDGATRKPEPESVRLRSAAYIADVSANGTGCPRGTWDMSISPNGETLTATFSHYETTVEDGTRISFKDCNLTVKMHAPRDVSYAVGAFYAQGYAFLEAGVRAFFTANYYMQGNPVPSAGKERTVELTGPIDRSFLLQDTPRDVDTIWSPCGLDRNLQVVTRVGLQKSQNKGSGYINMSDIDVETSGKIVLRVKTRPCGSAAPR